jgi:tetratricopeptide (TPR) repeat protein
MMLWRFIWFRYVAYEVALAVGKARRWLVSGWVLHMIGLAAVVGLWFAYRKTDTFNAWTFAAEVAVGYGLLRLIVGAYRSSGSVVVLTTVNHAGKDFDGFAAGLAAHLANDLRLLSELYRKIDDVNSPPQHEGFSTLKVMSTLKVGVDDPGDALASVVGEKSDVKLGPVSVSMRPFIAALERSIPKQRLSSSLHRTGNHLTLLADITGAEGNWRVERDLPADASAEDTASKLREMAKELVYRVFTRIVRTGSKEWEAVQRFSAGLRAYRLTLTTDMDSKINLREAERQFFEARSLDKTFARCSYNLGVVYRDRKRPQYAKAAFEQAIEDDPTHADAACALSLLYMDEARWPLALEFADRAIAHDPSNVQAWTIKGVVWQVLQAKQMERGGQPEQEAQTEESKQAKQTKGIKPEDETFWRSSLKYREMAAALAWRDLCRAAWRARPPDVPSQLIVTAFDHLADAHLKLGNRRRGIRIFRQAIRQQPTAELYLGLGNGLTAEKKVSRANLVRGLTAYRAAVQFAPTMLDRAYLHALVAETSAILEVRETERGLRRILVDLFITGRQGGRAMTAPYSALQACDRALVSPSMFASPSGKDLLSKLETVCRKSQDTHRCGVIECIGETVHTLKEKSGETNPKRCERITQIARSGALRMSEAPAMVPIIAWKRAIFFLHIAHLLMLEWQDRPNPLTIRRAERLFHGAAARLKKHYPTEELLGFAYERLAYARSLQSKFIDALEPAEMAIELDPFSASRMLQLGLAHQGLTNYDLAEQQLRKSFALDPSSSVVLSQIAYMRFTSGLESTNREDQRSECRNAIETLDQAIDLAEDDKYRAQLHFWRAAFHGYLMEYDPAKKQYQIARALGDFPSECYLELGENDIEQELLESAERYLRDALQEILKAKRIALQKARDDSSKDWWRTPQRSPTSSRGVPLGYFLLKVCLLLALVAVERGRDVARARRKLGFVDRHLKFLGKPLRTAEREELREFEDRHLEIVARYEDYLGWVCHLDNQPQQAREHLETSVKRRARPGNLYHLARVYLDQSTIDLAEDCCRRAKVADMRGAYSTRIAKIEAEVSRRRNVDGQSPRTAVESDPR